jgi:hypothetical protein
MARPLGLHGAWRVLSVGRIVRSLPLLVALVVAIGLGSSLARADGLSAAEVDRLSCGETVVRAQAIQRANRHYVGGVAYVLLDDSAADLARLLDDIDVWRRIVPRTRAAHRVMARGGDAGDARIEITNGTALVQATYTMRVRRDGSVIRFWMDRSRRHDIEDAWGFVRAEPTATGRTLVTYGVLIDMGPGIVRDLFEERVRTLALTVPDRLRGLVLERDAAGRRAWK